MRTLTRTLAMAGLATALAAPAAWGATDVAVDDPDGDVQAHPDAPAGFENRRDSYDIRLATLASDPQTITVELRMGGAWPAEVPEFNQFSITLSTSEDLAVAEHVWSFLRNSDDPPGELRTYHADQAAGTTETHLDGYCTAARYEIGGSTLRIAVPRQCVDAGRVHASWIALESFTPDQRRRAVDFAPDGNPAGPFALAPAEARPRPTPRDVATTCDPEQDHGFADSDGTVHDYSISCVAGHAIAKGTGDGSTFEPNATLSHGQAATFIRNTLDAAGAPLADSTVDHCDGTAGVHEDNLEALIDAGLLAPSYCEIPGVATDRAEMAHWVAGALDHSEVPRPTDRTDWFSDDDGHPFEPAIDRIASHGIVTGQGDGTYGPGHHLVRGQMATFLARTLDTIRDA